MATLERFEIELPPDLAAYVRAKVGGALTSDSAVVREAVRAMQQRDRRLREMRDMVDASLDDPRPSLTDEQVTEHFQRRASGDHA